MKVIANPKAGRGRTYKYIKRLRRFFRTHGERLDVEFTEAPGHATELADCAVHRGESRVLVVGGDGTVSEVANALAGSNTELAIVGTGTGNDLARSLGLPRGLFGAVEVAFGGDVRTIDLGRESDRYFVSSTGLGFPALVAQEKSRIKWVKGSPAYLLAVWQALQELRPVPVTLALDGEVTELSCSFVMVQNTAYTGGGLRLAPDAKLDDGLFDVAIVGPVGKLELLRNLPGVYRGKHLGHRSFSVVRCRRVRIESPFPMAKMFDGDVSGFSPLEAEVAPKSLRVVVPQGTRRPDAAGESQVIR